MRNKKGFEFSINFVVVLIISIIILILSIIFLKDLFTAAYKQQVEVDYRTQEQIKSLIRDGEKVALPFTTLQIRRGESDVFGLGILNVEEDPKDFYINVKYIAGYDVDKNPLPDPTFQILYRDKVERLPQHSEAILGISITTPTSNVAPGTYIFNAVVCYDDGCYPSVCPSPPSDPECTRPDIPSTANNLYDKTVHKLYVEVP